MSLIVNALYRYDKQNLPHSRGLFPNRSFRLGFPQAGTATYPAGNVEGRASRFFNNVLQSTLVRKHSASRVAWVFVGLMTILVFTTVSRSVSQIEAGIAAQDVLDREQGPTDPVEETAKKDTGDFHSSSRDLALPLSRHVLKFIPPPVNRHRKIAKLSHPVANKQAQPPAVYNQPATAVPEVARILKSLSFTDNNSIQTASVLKDPHVRLTAISCFDGRQQCTAIINNQTVRAGQAICGYTLVQIRSGEVLMRQNEKYSLLKMDRPE